MEDVHFIRSSIQPEQLGYKTLAVKLSDIGKCPKGKARKRSMAREGDIVCVTGLLGDSAGGAGIQDRQRARTCPSLF
ncbi:MAG: hypothetical protein M0Q53_04365 [Prolixibacteraceae bacterium]|jgi:thiamine monophosphate kinase|nr:hypothetical protein [Prolixibacteraceae bacterium]